MPDLKIPEIPKNESDKEVLVSPLENFDGQDKEYIDRLREQNKAMQSLYSSEVMLSMGQETWTNTITSMAEAFKTEKENRFGSMPVERKRELSNLLAKEMRESGVQFANPSEVFGKQPESPSPEKPKDEEKLAAVRENLGIKSETERPLSPEEQYIKQHIENDKSIADLIVTFSQPNVSGIQGSEKFHSADEISKSLNVIFTSVMTGQQQENFYIQQLPRTFGLREKVKSLVGEMKDGRTFTVDGRPSIEAMNQSMAKMLLESPDDGNSFMAIVKKFGGIRNENYDLFTYREVSNAMNYAIQHPEDPKRFEFFTRSYGVRQKAEKVVAQQLKAAEEYKRKK